MTQNEDKLRRIWAKFVNAPRFAAIDTAEIAAIMDEKESLLAPCGHLMTSLSNDGFGNIFCARCEPTK